MTHIYDSYIDHIIWSIWYYMEKLFFQSQINSGITVIQIYHNWKTKIWLVKKLRKKKTVSKSVQENCIRLSAIDSIRCHTCNCCHFILLLLDLRLTWYFFWFYQILYIEYLCLSNKNAKCIKSGLYVPSIFIAWKKMSSAWRQVSMRWVSEIGRS